MSGRTGFSVTKALGQAVAFLPRGLAGAGLPLLVVWLCCLAAQKVQFSEINPLLAVSALLGAVCVFKVMALGGLYRVALFGRSARAEGLGPLGLQFGLTEVRLLGAGLGTLAFLALVVAAIIVTFSIVLSFAGGEQIDFGALSAASLAPESLTGGLVTGFVFLTGLVALVLLTKLSLAQPASVAERRLVILNALSLSSGQTSRLFAGLMVILLPFVVAIGAFWHHMAHHDGMGLWLLHGNSPLTEGGRWGHALVELVLVAILMPLIVGYLASAYSQIRSLRS